MGVCQARAEVAAQAMVIAQAKASPALVRLSGGRARISAMSKALMTAPAPCRTTIAGRSRIMITGRLEIRGQFAWHVAALGLGGALAGQTAPAQNGNPGAGESPAGWKPLRNLLNGDCLVCFHKHPITQILDVWFAALLS
jgi:hypothetical protein